MKKSKSVGKRILSGFLSLVLLLTVVTACNQEEEMPAPQLAEQENIVAFLKNLELETEDVADEAGARSKGKMKNTFKTLAVALETTGLDAAVASLPLTVFAPTDIAFRKIGLTPENISTLLTAETLSYILTYHVIAGNVFASDLGDCYVQMFNEDYVEISKRGKNVFLLGELNEDPSKITAFDMVKDDDVMHVINRVLLPPDMTIAAIASMKGFSTLVNFIDAVELTDAVDNPDANLTVFAPTEDAFEALLGSLSTEAIAEISKPANLTSILLHHVVAGRIFSCDLSDGAVVTTQNGEDISVDLGSLSIISSSGNPASLNPDYLDIQGNNGVIHAINQVLVPQSIIDILAAL